MNPHGNEEDRSDPLLRSTRRLPLQAQAEALRAKEVAGVVARIREAIVHYGSDSRRPRPRQREVKAPKGAAVTAAPKSKVKTAGKKTACTIKFADGKGGTWSGIGKRPNWFKDALAAGRKPEDLLARLRFAGSRPRFDPVRIRCERSDR